MLWGGLGAAVLVVLVVTHRCSPADARRDSWRLCALVVLLSAFAVGFDVAGETVLTAALPQIPYLAVIWVEAFGEVAAMSALVAYVVHVVRRAPSTSSAAARLPAPDASRQPRTPGRLS